jgi:hypothetical protein
VRVARGGNMPLLSIGLSLVKAPAQKVVSSSGKPHG